MKFKMLRNLFFGLAALFAVSSCSVDDGGYYIGDDAAHGIIGNASPDSGDLYFFADNNQVNTNALNFGSAAGYYNFYPGDRVLSIKNATGQVLDSENVSLGIGEFFTAFAVDTPDNIEIVVYEDVLLKPDAGNARIRFINLSPDAAAIDVTNGSTEMASALEFKQASPFITVSAGQNYLFQYKLSSDDSLLYEQTITLQPGRIYTVYTKGYVMTPIGSNDEFSAETIHNY